MISVLQPDFPLHRDEMAVDLLLLSAILATTALLLFAVRDYRRYGGKGHLPPGPRPIPLLGNVLDIPRCDVGSAFSTLAKKYGAVRSDFLHHTTVSNNSSHRRRHFFHPPRATDGRDRLRQGCL